jgi:rhodanese-related sulfurtransferase
LIAQIAPAELAAWRHDSSRPAPAIVDVREPWEFERCRIEGSHLVPLRELTARFRELPQDRDLVLVCHHGGRSAQAAEWLSRNGFPRVRNLAGGVDAWSRTVDPAMPRY